MKKSNDTIGNRTRDLPAKPTYYFLDFVVILSDVLDIVYCILQ